MIRQMIDTTSKRYRLSEVNIGEFSSINGRGMSFRVKVYDAEGAGRLCLMKMTGFFGIMKMDTAVFSPTELDGPIFSSDSILLPGKEILLFELYDTTLSHPDFSGLNAVKERYANLPAYDPGEHWYDNIRLDSSDFKKGRRIHQQLEAYIAEYSSKYFDILSACESCDPEQKRSKNAEYADGLLNNGGPAVDQFRKIIGEEKTSVFLKKYMFGAMD